MGVGICLETKTHLETEIHLAFETHLERWKYSVGEICLENVIHLERLNYSGDEKRLGVGICLENVT